MGLLAPLVMAASVAACGLGGLLPQAPPPLLPEPRRAQRATPPPEWYWQPVEPDVRVAATPIELPVTESDLRRREGAATLWTDLGATARERVLRDGIAMPGGLDVHAHAHQQMGAFYTELRERRIPYVITLDALAYALHVAFERALAEVDDTLLAPGLDALLERLETRLAAEQKGAGVELSEALGKARAMVAVARGLSSPPPPPPPALPLAPTPAPALAVAPARAPLSMELSLLVSAEIARVQAHAGISVSPLLEAPVDYAALVAPPDASHPGSYRALAWLSSSPLLFVARSETRGAAVGVATARLHTRIAMVFARLALRDVDPEINALWSRLTRVLTFVWGQADDLSVTELAEAAASLAIPLDDPKQIANVVTVDRLRRRAAAGRAPQLFDGDGAPGRPGSALRLFGGHASADSIALAKLTGPGLGVGTAQPGPVIARDGARTLPSSLDLAAWLGAKEGRAAVHADSLDAFPGYDAALARAITMRPDDLAPSRHSSVHGSLLDVTMTWLAPEPVPARSLASTAEQRSAIESALAAWTFARHDGQPLTRALPSRKPPSTKELDVRGAALPAFVERAPDVIAALVGSAGQMRRGLSVVGGLPITSPAMTVLAEVEDLLRTAMRIATHEANDEALTEDDLASLAALPARLARLEENGASVPCIAVLAADAAGDRVLETATGNIEEAITVVRDPSTSNLYLAVGAHLTHLELVEPRATSSTDASHRARLLARGTESPARATYTTAFRVHR